MKLAVFVRFVVVSLVCSLAAHAADFEGTIKWSFRGEITDPELKKQMAKMQQEMADPAKRAQMKAMMEDPQMQAMMAQNPQMKAAMEAQMKMAESAAAGNGGDLLSKLMPSSMTLRTKGGLTNLQIEGGAMPTEVLGRVDPPETTVIDRQACTFSRVPASRAKAETGKAAPKVTKTAFTNKIMGYTCQQYLVETEREGKKLSGVFWVTKEIPGLDASTLVRTELGEDDGLFIQGVDGVPLQVEMTTPQAKIVVLASTIMAGKIADSVFVVPTGFRETPYVPAPALVGPVVAE